MTANSEPTKRKRGRPRADAQGTSTSTRARGRPRPDTDAVGPEALIEMTLGLLTEQAPSEITRASLARRANVDPGLIRYYFKNRDSLMRTAAETLTKELQRRAAVGAKQREALSPSVQVTARVQALLSFKLDNPFYHRLMMEEMARSEDDQSRALFHEIAAGAIERYRSYMAAGAETGELRQVDPAFLYMAIIGLCDFFVIASPVLAGQFQQKTAKQAQEAYSVFICDLLLNGLRPR